MITSKILTKILEIMICFGITDYTGNIQSYRFHGCHGNSAEI